MEPTTLTSLSGSLMSLFGLVVSLFSVHLGNWLSKLQGLRTRWDINSGSDDKEVAARRECRYVMAEVYTWQPFVMTLILMSFCGSVLYFFNDVRNSSGVVYPSIFVFIYKSFFIIMFVLQAVLLISGWRVGQGLKQEIDKQFTVPNT